METYQAYRELIEREEEQERAEFACLVEFEDLYSTYPETPIGVLEYIAIN